MSREAENCRSVVICGNVLLCSRFFLHIRLDPKKWKSGVVVRNNGDDSSGDNRSNVETLPDIPIIRFSRQIGLSRRALVKNIERI